MDVPAPVSKSGDDTAPTKCGKINKQPLKTDVNPFKSEAGSIEIDSALLFFRFLGLKNGRGGRSEVCTPSPINILVWTLGKKFAKRVPLARKSPKESRADDTNKSL